MITSIMSWLDSSFPQRNPEHVARNRVASTNLFGCGAGQIRPSPVCATGGKPSTWLPPVGLVEQAATRQSAFINTPAQKTAFISKVVIFELACSEVSGPIGVRRSGKFNPLLFPSGLAVIGRVNLENVNFVKIDSWIQCLNQHQLRLK